MYIKCIIPAKIIFKVKLSVLEYLKKYIKNIGSVIFKGQDPSGYTISKN